MVSIDVLPDDVLLNIFDFCVDQDPSQLYIRVRTKMPWKKLVHVCRRWRTVVFGSPLHLNLALFCSATTPARDKLDIWPSSLPIIIWTDGYCRKDSDSQAAYVDNINAALKCSDRVRQISLSYFPPILYPFLTAIHEPFPELTHLLLNRRGGPVIPDSFLGGFTPRLQYVTLSGLPYPGLPRLLSSATHLVDLQLLDNSDYDSHAMMVIMLPTLTRLENLSIEFSPDSLPNHQIRPPHSDIRSVLPVLTKFTFKGISEYLEYLMACIDAPRVMQFYVTFFDLEDGTRHTPQLIQFIHRTPTLKELERAHVIFDNDPTWVRLSSMSSLTSGYGVFVLRFPCRSLDRQVSSLTRVFTSESSFPSLFVLKDLYIYRKPHTHAWETQRVNIENATWLEFLHPFPTLKNLFLCREFAPCIMPALQELVGGRTTEALPNLQSIFLEELQSSGPMQEGIREFVAVRQVTSHPIAISLWDNSRRDMLWWY